MFLLQIFKETVIEDVFSASLTQDMSRDEVVLVPPSMAGQPRGPADPPAQVRALTQPVAGMVGIPQCSPISGSNGARVRRHVEGDEFVAVPQVLTAVKIGRNEQQDTGVTGIETVPVTSVYTQ